MTTETALPTADASAAASTTEQSPIAVAAIDAAGAAEAAAQQEAKPEKTESERELARMRRGIDRKTRQAAEAKAESAHLRAELQRLTNGANAGNNRDTEDGSEHLSLTRAQIQEMVTAEAKRLAPTLQGQATEVERRHGVVQGLAKKWGQERFDEISSDLDDAFGGLVDGHGKEKPVIEAIFEADDAVQVIEYLADPENAEEAESISRMSAAQAGKAIAKLEARFAATPAKSKSAASKAPAPLEAIRGAGPTSKALADLSGDDFAKRRREQIASRH